MKFSLEIQGEEKLLREMRRLEKVAPDRLDNVLFAATNDTRNTAIDSIRVSKPGGRTYQRGQVVHQASPQGGPPNADTGNLISNITLQKIAGGYDVGSRKGAPYGFFLEFKEASRGGRPWLKPAFNIGLQKLKDYIKRIKLK